MIVLFGNLFAQKTVFLVTSSADSLDTTTIKAISEYGGGTEYVVKTLYKSVLTMDDVETLNTADVVIMGRKIGSSDVGSSMAALDEITAPVLSINMWGLRDLDQKAHWMKNAGCDNIVSNSHTLLYAEFLVDDLVFEGIQESPVVWWNIRCC